MPGAANRYQHTADGRIIPVPRIFITGSTDGLGRAAAGALISEGHDVVLHARTRERAAALSDLAPDAAGVVIGDLSSAAETRDLAGQVNQIGRMDAVIHNAAVFLEPSRRRIARTAGTHRAADDIHFVRTDRGACPKHGGVLSGQRAAIRSRLSGVAASAPGRTARGSPGRH